MKIILFLAFIFIFVLMKATFLDAESAYKIYSSSYFEAIFIFLTFGLIISIFSKRIYKKPITLLFHISIIIILIGAGITKFFAYEGVLHLRNGEIKNFITIYNKISHKTYNKNLGFSVKLEKFQIKKYINSPISYDSFVKIIDKNHSFKAHIFENHILKYKGFRFYQMSYDKDEKGTILLVRKDYGMYVTYLGFLLFIISFISLFFSKKTYFKILLNKNFLLLFLLFFSPHLNALTLKDYAKNSSILSSEFSTLLVENNNRIQPVDSLALNVVYKLSSKREIKGLNYNQIFFGIFTHPKLFANFKMIRIKNQNIKKILNIKNNFASYNNFFSKNKFLLKNEVKKALKKSDEKRTQFDREILKLNQNLFLIYQIMNGNILTIFPQKGESAWLNMNNLNLLTNQNLAQEYYMLLTKIYQESTKFRNIKNSVSKLKLLQKENFSNFSEKRIKLEILYNRLNIFQNLTYIYLFLALFIIILSFIEILKDIEFIKVRKISVLILIFLITLQTFNMILRWYISNHAPWSDSYESIILIAWSVLIATLFFRKHLFIISSGFLIAGMFMFTAHLNEINPQITNIVPVLNSYWLLLHVSIITSSYGFLALSAVIGFFNMILFTINKEKRIFSDIIYLSIFIGLFLLSIGTILGAIWANESWGRYWSWDPKETWSFISIIIYALLLHSRFLYKQNDFIFSTLAFLSFFTIIMSYFGVNFYIATGLHSYGRGALENLGYIYGFIVMLDGIINFNLEKIIIGFKLTYLFWLFFAIIFSIGLKKSLIKKI